MDKVSILGIIIGLSAIFGGQILEGGSVLSLLQPTAFVVVVGGTMGAVLLQSPAPVFRRSFRMMLWVWRPPTIDTRRVIEQIIGWSQISRREGLLALETSAAAQSDPFVRKALQLLVDGAEPERLREVLDVDIGVFEDDLRQGAKLWESAGGYSPTIGILGAVMGLIHVMENLTDPAKLGAGIATAFVATIYGVGFANLILLPIANKLKTHIDHLVRHREMMVDGLIGIANGDNPRIIESRLKGYVS